MQKYITVLLVFLLTGCTNQRDQSDIDIESDKLSVLVSVVPQRYFVEEIAGDLVEVTVLIPPGASPAAYEPSPSDMRAVSNADVWFTIGLQLEASWVSDFSSLNEQLLIESTVENVHRLPIGRYGIPGEHAEHNHDHDHSHGGQDPHVWLSPELVTLQASFICRVLSEIDPGNSDTYSGNLTRFLEDIRDLQNEIHSLTDPIAGGSFMVFHPAWGYFADEFGLVQVPVQVSGSEPSPGEMTRLVDFGRNASVKVVFVSPQFSESSAETIAHELNARVVFIDPLALQWADNLLFVAGELAAAVEGPWD